MDVEDKKEEEPEKTPEEIAAEAEMAAMEAEWAAMTDNEIEQRTRLISHEISVRTAAGLRLWRLRSAGGSEGRSAYCGHPHATRAPGIAHPLLSPPRCRSSNGSTAAWCTSSTPSPKTSRTTRFLSGDPRRSRLPSRAR